MRIILVLVLVSLLAGCSPEPTFTPSPEVLANREAEAYDRYVLRSWITYGISVLLILLFSAILLILAWQLRGVGYRYQNAKVAKKEAENRRLDFIPLGTDKLYDTKYKTVISGAAQVANELPPIMPAEAIPTPSQNNNKRAEFVKRAAHFHPDRWRGKTIPRFDKMGYRSNAEWMEITRMLKDDELIDNSQGTDTVICEGQDLGWLYNLLITNPEY